MATPQKLMATALIGRTVGARYVLAALIEKGGQGAVYRARDLRDGDEVAIKVLDPAAANDPDFRERMFREARAMTMLAGTAAVRALDHLWTEDGLLCLVMELLEGKDLEGHLEDIEAENRRLSLDALLRIVEPIVFTLEAAHQQGIYHRDLKPANIFVLRNPGSGVPVRLLDFGFAKFSRMRSMTAQGFVAGSPSYMAPETWRGQPDLDQRIDVYSLAAVIFRCLAGVPPFKAKDMLQLLQKVTTAPRPSLHALRPELPKSVDDWVQQALAKFPEERFINVRGMWNAFKNSSRSR